MSLRDGFFGSWFVVPGSLFDQEPETKNHEPETKNHEPETKNHEPPTQEQRRRRYTVSINVCSVRLKMMTPKARVAMVNTVA